MANLFNFRKAEVKDECEVQTILGNLYYGGDYFPLIFLDLLRSSIWHIYVAVDTAADIVVASTAILVSDGGKTALWRYSRVRNSYQGKKLIKMLNSFALEDVRSLPSVEIRRQRLSVTCELFDKNRNILRNPSVFAYVESTSYRINFHVAKNLLSKQHKKDEKFNYLDLDQFKRYWYPKENVRRLLPNGLLQIEFDIFAVEEMNNDEEEFLKENQLQLCVLESPCSAIHENSRSNSLNKAKVDSLSLSNVSMSAIYWKPCKFNNELSGIRATIYATTERDAVSHIVKIVTVMMEKWTEEKSMQLKVSYVTAQKCNNTSCFEWIKEWHATFDDSFLHIDMIYSIINLESCDMESV